jgi:hypothetical protein
MEPCANNMFKIIFSWQRKLFREILRSAAYQEDSCLTPPVTARK